MLDETIVQPGQASTTEQVQVTETPKVEAQSLTEDRIKQLIAEATQAARTQGVETGKREMQSIKDREVAEAKWRTRQIEMEKQGIESSLSELDDETKTKIELAKYRARERNSQDYEREEQARQSVTKTYGDFNTNMTQYITDLGIDPKKMDWGDETEPLLTKQQRILSQVGKFQKDMIKAEKESVSRTVKDEIAKARRELGLDSTDEPATTVTKAEYAGIPTDTTAFRKWIEKMPQDEYEKKWADKVTKMRREGLL